jgi:hypothetical protein
MEGVYAHGFIELKPVTCPRKKKNLLPATLACKKIGKTDLRCEKRKGNSLYLLPLVSRHS